MLSFFSPSLPPPTSHLPPTPKTAVNEEAVAVARDCASEGLLRSQLTSIPDDPQHVGGVVVVVGCPGVSFHNLGAL